MERIFKEQGRFEINGSAENFNFRGTSFINILE
jgi:hypothetical protein